MAYIVDFEIESLAGRPKPYTATLNRDVNIFFGLNGSGKTTLLKILHSALAADTGILRDLPFARASVTVHLNRYDSPFVRTFSKSQFEESIESTELSNLLRSRLLTSSSALPKWSSQPEEPEGTLTSQKTGFLPITRLYRNVTTSSGSKQLSDQELDKAFAQGLQAQWREYYADISTKITQTTERGLAHILGFFLSGDPNKTESIDAPSEQVAYDRIKAFLARQSGFGSVLPSREDFAKIYSQRLDLRHVVQQIETVENEIKGINAPREKFRSVLETMYTGNKKLTFTDKEIEIKLPSEKNIGLTLLSSGEKQLLYIAFHALIGNNFSLIVDEPELSMHVDWQKKLVATLHDLNPNIQQIMATHSPEIMADVPDDKVFPL
jgi:energy-coupling factor transporter ATP-binding protein EcfA2